MSLHNETAAPMVGPIGNGGNGISKALTAEKYQNPIDIATGFEYAAAKLTSRFRLGIETARVICSLSGLGGVA